VEGHRLEIRIRPHQDRRYTTRFIGAGGQLLGISHGTEVAYELTGSESYVRARIDDSRGEIAWVQPVFVEEVPTDRPTPPRR